MKRFLILLLCLVIAAACPVCRAEDDAFSFFGPSDDSRFNTVDGSREAIEITIDGRSTQLAFDGSQEYSSIIDGTVQASFFAYSDNSEYVFELYMVFPDTVRSGSVLTPEQSLKDDPDCSVVLILNAMDKEQYFFAGQSEGRIYPDGSTYSMNFESVTSSELSRTYTGTLTATLAAMDQDTGDPLVPFAIQDAPFTFTISLEENDEDGNPFEEFPHDEHGYNGPTVPMAPTATPRAYKV